MIIGENPNKVENIVSSSMAMFDVVYTPILRDIRPAVKVRILDFI